VKVLSLFFLASIISTCQGIPHQIGGHHYPGIDCLSWHLAVETNIRDWEVAPQACENCVGHSWVCFRAIK